MSKPDYALVHEEINGLWIAIHDFVNIFYKKALDKKNMHAHTKIKLADAVSDLVQLLSAIKLL